MNGKRNRNSSGQVDDSVLNRAEVQFGDINKSIDFFTLTKAYNKDTKKKEDDPKQHKMKTIEMSDSVVWRVAIAA